MSKGWEGLKPAPLEFLHSKLLEHFHDYRESKTEDAEVLISGMELTSIIAKAKMDTLKEYPNLKLDENQPIAPPEGK